MRSAYSLSRISRVWFTLFEIMIVIAMILILLGSGLYPYSYYMERARAEKTMDKISQEWILAHQAIRGWLLHEGTGSHAHMYIQMKKWSWAIIYSTSTGGTSPKVEYRKYTFDPPIQILGFTGSIDATTADLVYHISPPFATGAFSTGTSLESYLSGVILTIGYPGATRESRRARDILLRPYFD